MSDVLYLTTICLMLGTVVLVFGMRALSSFMQARARLANEGAYQSIARTAAAAETQTATALSAIEAALGDVKGRLAAIEKVLKDVG